jgi:hypothetical protein
MNSLIWGTCHQFSSSSPCAVGAVWIAQGSGAMHGSGMSGHAPFALLGRAAVIVGLALLVWAALIRRRRTYS